MVMKPCLVSGKYFYQILSTAPSNHFTHQNLYLITTHSTTYPFNHPPIQPPTQSTIHPFNHPPIQPPTHSTTHPITNLPIQPPTHLTIHPFNHPPNQQSTHSTPPPSLTIHPFNHSIKSTTHSTTHPFSHPLIQPFTHSTTPLFNHQPIQPHTQSALHQLNPPGTRLRCQRRRSHKQLRVCSDHRGTPCSLDTHTRCCSSPKCTFHAASRWVGDSAGTDTSPHTLRRV